MAISLETVKQDIQTFKKSKPGYEFDKILEEPIGQESFIYDPVEGAKWRASAEFLKARESTKQLRHDIKKGLIYGENKDTLFLKAIECISIAVDDKDLLSSVQEILFYTSPPNPTPKDRIRELQRHMDSLIYSVENMSKQLEQGLSDKYKEKLNKMIDLHTKTYTKLEEQLTSMTE